MVAERFLIVNADDFGLSDGVNRGIQQAHEQGIVTSASLMVRWPAAVAAANYAREHPELSVGLHVDLGEWTYRPDGWVCLYEVVPHEDEKAVAQEVTSQLTAFRHLLGRDPTHLDSHQHVHQKGSPHFILAGLAQELGIPLRNFSPQVNYLRGFYGQKKTGEPLPEAISVDGLIRLVANLPPGITELGCHPGEAHDLDSLYRNERLQEVMTLCHPRVRAALVAAGIELRSFHMLAGKNR
jgi:predicted glycoside hydrolase/deacetylase ChbG (UPF0249 family)